jgi:hypothetical protein
MDIERGMIRPKFEQRQLVRIKDALEHFELLASGLLHDLRTAVPEDAREFRSFSRRGGKRDDKSN